MVLVLRFLLILERSLPERTEQEILHGIERRHMVHSETLDAVTDLL